MKHNLTKIASLPGSGGGCMSSLPAEKNEAKKPEPKPLWMGVDYGRQESATVYWTRALNYRGAGAAVQMKAEYFQEEVPLPKIDTVDEMARKILAAVQRAH